eukprot:CAMPEP_0184658570 /NCGR_PEP_ID=MMETSP0308-20130426/26002_1 /TAXON_ID=38269 /ORGANISM="Gloeochaete witrockiana, Strain SAG 46.84" /LENGTH=87 /DNA_ID=CAMNT_0027097671 /DNA_START=646 /DNA_END=909 /DNA_ORIENTATION=+
MVTDAFFKSGYVLVSHRHMIVRDSAVETLNIVSGRGSNTQHGSGGQRDFEAIDPSQADAGRPEASQAPPGQNVQPPLYVHARHEVPL